MNIEQSPSQSDGSDNRDYIDPNTSDITPDIVSKGSSSSKTNAIQLSVDRTGITSTLVKEGEDELKGLDVEVYDQQTYEKGVFEQVNRAISEVDKTTSDEKNDQPPSQQAHISDLIRLIHDQDDGGVNCEEENCDTTLRDEQVLQLTRQQRLNKTIKVEKVDSPQESTSYSRLPKIPKISRIKFEPLDDYDQARKTIQENHSGPSRIPENVPSLGEQYNESEAENSDDCSNSSEYKPSASEQSSEDELEDENIDYEDDSPESSSEEVKISGKKKAVQDDGDFKCYQARIKSYTKKRAQTRLDNIQVKGTELEKLDETVDIEGDLQIPKEVWDGLFEHQKTGVRWLWELHQLGTGGILGDEMGLGKTIQMIAFLVGLKTSNSIDNAHNGYRSLGPTVLVCPATVMHQWLLEFRKWWPQFRVAILHSTGNFSGDRKNLVQVINKSSGILIVSYPGVVIYQDYLHNFDWHYVILDEGHKIRNPDAQVTLACKRFRTPHRIILSGSPVQNNLRELWSIFDFIYPGKLGTLPVFMEQFAIPITQGGYANASDIQVQIAYKCSCVLRDTIKPFLLRRTKAEVNSKLKLPDRSEQVLFCKLTEKQRKLYQAYIDSPTVRDIKAGRCQIFAGLIQLRKICNHPDIFDASECQKHIKQAQEAHKKKHLEFYSEDETYGHFRKSGKMMVVEALLKLWRQQEHKVLLFTQSRQMLKIFMKYLDEKGYKYLVMDGTTPIGCRQTMIEQFNNDEEIFIFLLTTRVGGVGVNLTGANRIIIYDPDWNPSTDIQARERAWRIGQQRHVIIYRLLTAGTIEEKIYHRQVFKLYLTNRILKDAKQKRFFKTNDMHELFTLGDNDKNIETKALFDDDLQINPETIKREKMKSKALKKKRKQLRKDNENQQQREAISLPEEKLQAMRERAKRLSQMIALQYGSQSRNGAEEDDVNVKKESLFSSTNNSSIKIKIEPNLESHENPIINQIFLDNPVSSRSTLSNGKQVTTRTEKESVQPEKRAKKKQCVEYLVKQDIYKPEGVHESADKRYERDDYILERLFKSANVFGALKHDKIETDSTSDFKVVESEAERVARDAIRALRESRRLCLHSSAGVPNWTGRNGHVAERPRMMPKSKSRAQLLKVAPSSSSSGSGDSLLSAIKKRNQSNPVALIHNTFHSSSLDSDEEEERDKDFAGAAKEIGAEKMADKIRDFFLFKSARSGEAQTDELLSFFNAEFKSKETAIFKAILYKMCQFQRRSDKGFWMIKSEYRDM